MIPLILGGGLAGLSLAHFINSNSIILEKEEEIGGLCRSFNFNNIYYDIGPHILYSKDKKLLDKITSFTETTQLRRSNKILFKNRFIKYPFENDLASLPKEDCEYCLQEFITNPYENYPVKNMLQFFLKTFGEGITKLYLQPYNEKIWKFHPAYMSTQLVERIPKPPKEDVIKSARGIPTEGYKHQLYFHYPKSGGIHSMIRGIENHIAGKTKIVKGVNITKIKKENVWKVSTNKGEFTGDLLVNCMPMHELFRYLEAPKSVLKALLDLKYNSIFIIVLQTKKDTLGNNFAFYVPDNDLVFHRLTKLDFFGENYQVSNGSTLMAEITYRPGGFLSTQDNESIITKVLGDLEKMGIIDKRDVFNLEMRNVKYAYVIYDLDHKKNKDIVIKYLENVGIKSCGRFAEFEYLNMDQVVEHSLNLATRLNS